MPCLCVWLPPARFTRRYFVSNAECVEHTSALCARPSALCTRPSEAIVVVYMNAKLVWWWIGGVYPCSHIVQNGAMQRLHPSSLLTLFSVMPPGRFPVTRILTCNVLRDPDVGLGVFHAVCLIVHYRRTCCLVTCCVIAVPEETVRIALGTF